MDGFQWFIVILFMIVTFVVMEAEKALRNYLTTLKYDTEDKEYGFFDETPEPDDIPLPAEVDRFGRNEAMR